MVYATRLFPLKDVLWFAEVSGDPNPVHIDPAFAARSYPGEVVAHGVHLVLWALEAMPIEDMAAFSGGLKAIFQRPVIAEEEVSAEVVKPGTIALHVGATKAATIRLKADKAAERWAPAVSTTAPAHPPILQGPPNDGEEVSGALRLPENREALTAAFPNLGRRLGPRVLQGLAGIAPVSGGVLGGVTTEFAVQPLDDSPSDNLEYRLLSYYAPMRRFELAFWGYGVIGKAAAVVGDGIAPET